MNKYYKHIFAAAAGIICLIIYIVTLNPAVTFMDSGELAAVCTTFGIPHPTGYPLFLILGYFFSKLPFSPSPVYNLNLMSAVISACAVIVFYYLAYSIIKLLALQKSKQEPKQLHKQKKGKPQKNEQSISYGIIITASFFSALVLGFSRTFWSNALSVEVYSLHALLLIIVLYYCIKIFSTLKEHNKKYWILLFVSLGLSFANHMTTVFAVPGVLYIFYLQYKENPGFAKSIYPLIFWSVPGLLFYIVLMLRASSEPYMNWSDPKTFGGLYHHITGGDYSQLMFSSSSVFSKNAKLFFSTVLDEYAVISGIISVIGLIYLYFKNKNVFYFFIVIITGCLLYSFNYNIRDLLSYFLPVYITLGLAFGAGLIFILNILVSKVNLHKNITALLIVSGIILSVYTFKYNYEANNHSGNFVIEDLTLNTLSQLEPNAILLIYDWGYVYPASLYYQQVIKLRGDVKVFNVKFLSVSWYLNMIKKYYPDVYENCKIEIDSYIGSDRNEKMQNIKLNSLIKEFITKNAEKYPVYMTYDFAYSKEMKPVLSNYLIQPDGLVYKLTDKNAPYNSDAGVKSLEAKFRTYLPDTKEKEKVFISTAGVYYDNAEYHFNRDNPVLAVKFTDKALEINPNFKEAIALKTRILKGSPGK